MLYAEVSCVRTWLFAAILYTVTLLPLCGSQPHGEGIPFTFRDGLIWFQVNTPRTTAPMNFLLDLGSETSVLNLRTAERLGLRLKNKTKVQGVSSTAIGYWAEPVTAQMGGLEMPTKYLAVDLGELSGACACRVDGLLGADFFAKRVLEIDFVRSELRLSPDASEPNAAISLPLQLKRGALRVPLQINGGAMEWVRLDTGCASSLEWVCPAKRIPDADRLAVGLTDAPRATVRTRVQLGNTTLEDVATGLRLKAIFPGEAGLLGNGILSRFAVVTIDCKNRSVLLRERDPVQRSDVASSGP